MITHLKSWIASARHNFKWVKIHDHYICHSPINNPSLFVHYLIMHRNLETCPLFLDDCTGKANPCQKCHRRKNRLYYYCDGGAKAAKRKCNSGYKCVSTGNCQTKCEKVIKATTTTTTTAAPTVNIRPTGDKGETILV